MLPSVAVAVVAVLCLATACQPADCIAVPGCGSPPDGESLCFVHPQGCLTDQSCKVGFSAKDIGGRFLVNVSAAAKAYVSIALTGQGHYLTVDCLVDEEGHVKISPTLDGYRQPNHTAFFMAVTPKSSAYSSGELKCSFTVLPFYNDPATGGYSLYHGSWTIKLAAGDSKHGRSGLHEDIRITERVRAPCVRRRYFPYSGICESNRVDAYLAAKGYTREPQAAEHRATERQETLTDVADNCIHVEHPAGCSNVHRCGGCKLELNGKKHANGLYYFHLHAITTGFVRMALAQSRDMINAFTVDCVGHEGNAQDSDVRVFTGVNGPNNTHRRITQYRNSIGDVTGSVSPCGEIECYMYVAPWFDGPAGSFNLDAGTWFIEISAGHTTNSSVLVPHTQLRTNESINLSQESEMRSYELWSTALASTSRPITLAFLLVCSVAASRSWII